MARGFESKSVESQQFDRQEKTKTRHNISTAELERQKQRESVEMSRRRILSEIEATTSPVRKASLQHALRFLDEELKKLG
jgi:hypothetical protein